VSEKPSEHGGFVLIGARDRAAVCPEEIRRRDAPDSGAKR